ncbi:unnamed protein product [Notodromas monacha]|uniref:DUF7027 domain-containing protein n=1 Tax=Notodromas monacha TaxID=399045 RepID=A0A7R9BVG8_9CRUS|nr:unnamed protein product [Notodromas monacha]CAG0921148.1 unnamed protein product [Notodromas monacha]
MTGIVYGILVIAVSVISLSTGYDYDENDTYKENLFKNLQYTAMGMGVLFIISSCLLVHGVQKENRFFQIPWLVCTGLQIVEIFIGAVMTFVSLNVTASMIFALVLNMIVGAGFCYCFFVVYQHYQLLIFLAKPEALRFVITALVLILGSTSGATSFRVADIRYGANVEHLLVALRKGAWEPNLGLVKPGFGSQALGECVSEDYCQFRLASSM